MLVPQERLLLPFMEDIGFFNPDFDRRPLSFSINYKGAVRLNRTKMVVSNRHVLELWPISNNLKGPRKVSVIGQKVRDLVRVTLESVQDQLATPGPGTDRNLVNRHFLKGPTLSN